MGSTDLPGANQDSEAGREGAKARRRRVANPMDGVSNPSLQAVGVAFQCFGGRRRSQCALPSEKESLRLLHCIFSKLSVFRLEHSIPPKPHQPIDATPPNPHNSAFSAPVAQLDRVPGYELGGREFESLRARH
jgi:hypothetical protein